MDIEKRIESFVRLGQYLKELTSENTQNTDILNHLTDSIHASNEWFTRESILFSLKALSSNLTDKTINEWLVNYPEIRFQKERKKVGLITAGNIPLVGFHDFLSVMMAGHEVVIKPSSKDDKLMKEMVKILVGFDNEFEKLISFEKDHLKKFDAIIATGSNNSAKYFEYYFGKYPNIIRKNRNSMAVLSGNETRQELDLLADDMLLYFGLGCRNVSKIFIPADYNLNLIFESLYKYREYINHHKFFNNYTYNKSIYLMNKIPFLENGFLLLKEDDGLVSPISAVYFEKYREIEDIRQRVLMEKEQIQCIVAKDRLIDGSIPFGESQKPKLWDYADNVDTLKFLLSLHK